MDNLRAIGPAFLVTLIVFVVLDALWLMLVAGNMFQQQLGAILRPQPMLAAAAAFYPIYAIGLYALAVRPAIAARSMASAAAKGAMLGLTAYATFDLTNLAIINGWTVRLAVSDMTWGIVASAFAAVAGTGAGLRGLASRQVNETAQD